MSSKSKPQPTTKHPKLYQKDKPPIQQSKSAVSPQPNQIPKKLKINVPPPQPLTQQEIQAEQQRTEALNRLNLLQEISQLTQQKKSTLLLESVFHHVQQDIVSSIVEIPEQPEDITKFMQKKINKEKAHTKELSESELLEKEYKSLVQKKEIMIQQLREMEIDENKIRKLRTDTTLSNSNSRINKMPEMTEDVKQRWRKVRQMVKDHEQNSHRMYQLNLQKMRQDQALTKELEEKKNKQLSIEKRKAIEKKLEEIKNRHDERTKHVKESEIIVERLQKKTKLFQKMHDNWTKAQQELQCQDQIQQFQSHHARRLISIRQLKRYEHEHDERFQENEEKRKIKLSESKLATVNYSFQKTRFSVDVIEEAKRKKEMEEEKLHQIRDLVSKKKQYATSLKQKFKFLSRLQSTQNLSKRQKDKDQGKSMEKEVRSMSALDIRNKGNEYMRTINSGMAGMKERSQSKKELKPLEPIKKEYKNYLPDVLSSLKQGEGSNSALKKNMDMISSIMGKETAPMEERFLQAQMITKKLESGGKQKDILNSINAKIQILKRISTNN